jgi:CRP/FNR family transcriptional regulator, cyclic AMP receptor protein
MIDVTTASLGTHSFFRGMPGDQLAGLAGSASVVSFPAGRRIFEVGGNATRFWLIRSGRVALQLGLPGGGRVTIETLGMGDVLGLSWLLPPFRWTLSAMAVGPVEAFEFDAASVRARCASDPVLGYELTRRFMGVSAHRLYATRMKLLRNSGVSENWQSG